MGSEQIYEPGRSLADAPQVELNAESAHLYDVAGFDAPLNADSYLGADQGTLPQQLPGQQVDVSHDGPFYRERSPLVRIAAVRAPVFLYGAEYDIFQRTEPNLFDSLRLPTDEKKLVMVPGYHVSAADFLGAKDAAGHAIPTPAEAELAWSDHWLAGKANGVQSLPTIERYYFGTDEFIPESREPLPGEGYQRWYLDAQPSGTGGSLYDGSLLPANAIRHPGSTSVPWDPFTGVCSRNPAQYLYGEDPDDIDGVQNPCNTNESTNDHAAITFTTAPFTRPYTEVGPMDAHLWISSSKPDTEVVAIVSDLAPDGNVDQVAYGTLIGSDRTLLMKRCLTIEVLDCSRYTPSGEIIVPWHPFTAAAQAPLVPGRAYPLDVEILPSALTLEPGHRLRLSLLTGDFPHTVPTTAFTREAAGGTTTFLFDVRHPSWLYLGTPG